MEGSSGETVSMMDLEQIKHHVQLIQPMFESNKCPVDGVFSFNHFCEGLRKNMVNRNGCGLQNLLELQSFATKQAELAIELFRKSAPQKYSERSAQEGAVTGERLLLLISELS
jgi:hypothetical protein